MARPGHLGYLRVCPRRAALAAFPAPIRRPRLGPWSLTGPAVQASRRGKPGRVVVELVRRYPEIREQGQHYFLRDSLRFLGRVTTFSRKKRCFPSRLNTEPGETTRLQGQSTRLTSRKPFIHQRHSTRDANHQSGRPYSAHSKLPAATKGLRGPLSLTHSDAGAGHRGGPEHMIVTF